MGAGVRVATSVDAATIAALLDAFNREFDTPTPGVEVLERRLAHLLGGEVTHAILHGDPATGCAVITLRPNVWYDGPVALLDELYVVPAMRNHGIGTELLQAAEQLARSHGCESFEINVDGQDTAARRFYERHGYSCIEPGRSEPATYYVRVLDDP